MLRQIIMHAPLWVWPLLLGLVVLGLVQARDRSVPGPVVLALPVVMVAYSAYGLIATFGLDPRVLAAWGAGVAATIALNQSVFGIPHGANVLTNLPFLVLGVWGLLRLARAGGTGAGNGNRVGLWVSVALLAADEWRLPEQHPRASALDLEKVHAHHGLEAVILVDVGEAEPARLLDLEILAANPVLVPWPVAHAAPPPPAHAKIDVAMEQRIALRSMPAHHVLRIPP